MCQAISYEYWGDYLKVHSLLYERLEGQKRMEITPGVAQGSILRPDLWNASYDSLLRLDMPEESRLVGYGDDVATIVAGRTVEYGKWMDDCSRKIPSLRFISISELTI